MQKSSCYRNTLIPKDLFSLFKDGAESKRVFKSEPSFAIFDTDDKPVDGVLFLGHFEDIREILAVSAFYLSKRGIAVYFLDYSGKEPNIRLDGVTWIKDENAFIESIQPQKEKVLCYALGDLKDEDGAFLELIKDRLDEHCVCFINCTTVDIADDEINIPWVGFKRMVVASVLDDCFENGYFDLPFVFVGKENLPLFLELTYSLLASMKPLYGDSEFYLSDSLSFKGNVLEDVKEGFENPLFGAKLQYFSEIPQISGVYLISVSDAKEAVSSVNQIKKACEPRAIYLVCEEPTSLMFFEGELSAYANCPVKVISPVSFALLPTLFKGRRAELVKNRFYLSGKDSFDGDFLSYPLREGAENVLYFFRDEYSYNWHTFAPLYSSYVYRSEFPDARLKDLIGENEFLYGVLSRGEYISNFALYDAVTDYYEKSDSTMWGFANYEHTMWARRTIIYGGLLHKKENYFVKLADLIEKEKTDSENALEYSSDIIFPDFLPAVAFLSEIAAKSRQKFSNYKDFDAFKKDGAIDLDRLVNETDISGGELLSLLLNLSESDYRYERLSRIDLTKEFSKLKDKDKFSQFIALAMPRSVTLPPPGTIITQEGEPTHFLIQAFPGGRVEEAFHTVGVAFGHPQDPLEPRMGTLPLINPHHLNVQSPCDIYILAQAPSISPYPSTDWNKSNQTIWLYALPFLPQSGISVLIRKKISDELSLGENAIKAFQTPLNDTDTLDNSPFTKALDPHGTITGLISYATHMDEYLDNTVSCTQSILENIALTVAPASDEFPYLKAFKTDASGTAFRGIAPEIEENALPMVFSLPFPILDKTFLPYLATLFRCQEKEILDFAEGNLFIDGASLLNGVIAFETDKGLSFEADIDRVLLTLADEANPFYQKAIKDLGVYPFGECLERCLLLRLIQIGLLSKKTFYHSVLPLSEEGLDFLLSKANLAGAYERCLFLLANDIYDLEHGGNKQKTLQNANIHANYAFRTLYMMREVDRHLSAVSSSFSRQGHNALARQVAYFNKDGCALDRLYHVFAARDYESYYGKRMDGRAEPLRFDLMNCVGIYLCLLNKEELKDIEASYRRDYSANLLGFRGSSAGLVIGEEIESMNVLINPKVGFRFGADDPCKDESFVPGSESILFGLKGGEKSKFYVVAKYNLYNRLYYLICPERDLDWISQDEVVAVYVTRLAVDPYQLENNAEIVDQLIEGKFDF